MIEIEYADVWFSKRVFGFGTTSRLYAWAAKCMACGFLWWPISGYGEQTLPFLGLKKLAHVFHWLSSDSGVLKHIYLILFFFSRQNMVLKADKRVNSPLELVYGNDNLGLHKSLWEYDNKTRISLEVALLWGDNTVASHTMCHRNSEVYYSFATFKQSYFLMICPTTQF